MPPRRGAWRRLRIAALAALVGGCATVDAPKPLTSADVVALSKQGKAPKEIIEELKRTDTVIPLQASDIVALHESGVPNEVLDYLQRVQIEEMRWSDRNAPFYWYGTMNRGFGPCPWPYRGFSHPYVGGPWGC